MEEAQKFSTRTLPWMKLGTVIEDPVSPGEAIKLAGLDWRVDLAPLQAVYRGKVLDVPDRFAVVRDSDSAVLGNVGSKYETFQNEEAFEFFTPLTDAGDAVIHAAGPLRHGRVVFMVAKAPESIDVLGDDSHDLFWLLRTSHDGTKAVEVALMMLRGRCMNSLGMPSFTREAQQRWAVTHVSTLKDRLAEAQSTMTRTDAYVESFVQTAERLAAIDVELGDFTRLLEQVLPDRPRRPEVIERMSRLFESSPTNGFTGNGWGAVNAISEYFDWSRDTRSDEARLYASVDGVAARTRGRAAAMLLAR